MENSHESIYLKSALLSDSKSLQYLKNKNKGFIMIKIIKKQDEIYKKIIERSGFIYDKLSENEIIEIRTSFFQKDENYKIFNEVLLTDVFYKELDLLDVFNMLNTDMDLNKDENLLYNKIHTDFSGYGNNKFVLNEMFIEDLDFKKVDNLFDYSVLLRKNEKKIENEAEDIKNKNTFVSKHTFVNKEDNLIHSNEEDLHLEYLWARMFIEGDFHYSELVSANKHIERELVDYIYSKDYSNLRPHIISYLISLRSEIQKDCRKLNKGVVISYYEEDDEKNIDVVINDSDTAKKIKWETFYENIKENQIDETCFGDILSKYKKILDAYVK